MRFPIILEATIANLAANAVGAPADSRGLQNRTGKILRIEELRFRVTNEALSEITDDLTPRWIIEDSLTMTVQLRIGNEPVTAGFVPIVAMTWPVGDFDFAEGLMDNSEIAARVVRFSKPVFVHPGQTINIQARHTYTVAQRLVVTAICSEADSAVGGVTPWFAFYQALGHADGGGNFEDVSTEADLVNPFDMEMEIERFIGRQFFDASIGSPRFIPVESTNPQGQYAFVFDLVRVRIDDHEATQIVRDATPFGIVFDFLRKSWVVNSMLAPKGFYRVSIQSNFAVAAIGGSRVTIPVVGMLGYRPVR